MTDLATLGIAVRSDEVVSANDNLERLGRTEGQTERATNQYARGARQAETASQRVSR